MFSWGEPGRATLVPSAERGEAAMANADHDERGVNLQAVEERALSAHAKLAAICGAEAPSDFMKIVFAVLETQHPDGSWGSNDTPKQKPTLTAATIGMLTRLGIEIRSDTIRNKTVPSEPVYRALRWLRHAQLDDGRWGEDAWDTCQVIRTLWKCGFKEEDEGIQKALQYLRVTVDDDWKDHSSYWFGAGFQGAALEVFNLVGAPTYAAKVLDQLMEYYDDTIGCFSTPKSPDDPLHAPDEWHTANALIGLHSYASVLPNLAQTTRAVNWLKACQREDGCWSPGHFEIMAYTTCQSVIALSLIDGWNSSEARRGTDWLVEQCIRDNMSHRTLLLMAGTAISRTHHREVVATIDFLFLRELQDLLMEYLRSSTNLLTDRNDLRAQLAATQAELEAAKESKSGLESQLAGVKDQQSVLRRQWEESRESETRLQQKISEYALKLTANQLAVLGVFLTIVTFILSVIIELALAD
jgi:hypothetical protein